MAAPAAGLAPNLQGDGFVFYNGPAALPSRARGLSSRAVPPPVVFTLGRRPSAQRAFYHESAKPAARAGVRAVLPHRRFAANQPARVPDGVLLVDRAPHQLLFPRARRRGASVRRRDDAQALRAGCPMSWCRTATISRDNAHRVTRLGVARTLYPKGYTAARAASELRRLLDDPAYSDRARRVAGVVTAEGGAGAAADALASVALTAVA
jgi:UDP:flavonoid glycosyltransferase YjiC (YdhE family)